MLPVDTIDCDSVFWIEIDAKVCADAAVDTDDVVKKVAALNVVDVADAICASE